MSQNKRLAPDTILVNQKKLARLRKSLTKIIDEFKSSVLKSLSDQDVGSLKDGLRVVAAQKRNSSSVLVNVPTPTSVAPADFGLEKWIAQGMPKFGDSLQSQSQEADQSTQVIPIVKHIESNDSGLMPANELEQWVNRIELSPVSISLAAFVDKVAIEEVVSNDSNVRLEGRPERIFRFSNAHVFFAGLDNLVCSSVRNFLQKTGMQTFLPALEKQSSLSIIEHFQEHNDFQFAVVVLSADEFMYQRIQSSDNALMVSSQKTVYELGFLVGKLGRNRVVVFYEDNEKFKRPTEYFDLKYILFDAHGQWQQQLINQMRLAGIAIKEETVFAL